jgi:ATP-dependent Clp protease ATP-binding subunit ClpB
MFMPLTQEEIKQIVRLQLENVKKMLAENNGVQLEYTEAAVESLAKEGYDPQFGARPVKRVIQRKILNRLAKDIIAGTVDKTKPIIIDAVDDTIFFRN